VLWGFLIIISSVACGVSENPLPTWVVKICTLLNNGMPNYWLFRGGDGLDGLPVSVAHGDRCCSAVSHTGWKIPGPTRLAQRSPLERQRAEGPIFRACLEARLPDAAIVRWPTEDGGKIANIGNKAQVKTRFFGYPAPGTAWGGSWSAGARSAFPEVAISKTPPGNFLADGQPQQVERVLAGYGLAQGTVQRVFRWRISGTP